MCLAPASDCMWHTHAHTHAQGDYLARRGHYAAARALLSRAAGHASDCGNREAEARCLLALSRAELAANNPTEAITLVQVGRPGLLGLVGFSFLAGAGLLLVWRIGVVQVGWASSLAPCALRVAVLMVLMHGCGGWGGAGCRQSRWTAGGWLGGCAPRLARAWRLSWCCCCQPRPSPLLPSPVQPTHCPPHCAPRSPYHPPPYRELFRPCLYAPPPPVNVPPPHVLGRRPRSAWAAT